MIRLIYEMLKGINKNIDKNEQLKEKDRMNALEEEMDMYGLDDDEKELVRKRFSELGNQSVVVLKNK